MTAIIRMYEQGAASVLRYEEETVGHPGEGQVLVRQAAIGVNYVDVLYRNGHFGVSTFPFINGFEAAGTIEAVGSGVQNVRVGDRGAYHFFPGAYASGIAAEAALTLRRRTGGRVGRGF